MFQKIAKHRANDASHNVHRPPLIAIVAQSITIKLDYLLQSMYGIIRYEGEKSPSRFVLIMIMDS